MWCLGGLLLALLVGTMVLTGPGHAAETLVVALYGGEWGDAITKAILRPFERKTSVRITTDPGVSRVTLSKLNQHKAAPVIDVAWMDGGFSELALGAGVLETLDPRAIPNIAAMVPGSVYRSTRGEIFGLSTGYYALGLVYNKERLKAPPTSYMDIFRPQFAGKMTMPSAANAMGLPLVIVIAEIRGGSIANIAPAMRVLRQAKPAAFFDTAGIGTNLFASGEVVIGVHFASAAWVMSDRGLPIGYAVPNEGALAGDMRVHVAKGTKRRWAAQMLVNYAVSVDAQKALAEILYVAPTASGIELSAKARARMPYGSRGSIGDLRMPDWQAVNARRSELMELWDKEVASGRQRPLQ